MVRFLHAQYKISKCLKFRNFISDKILEEALKTPKTLFFLRNKKIIGLAYFATKKILLSECEVSLNVFKIIQKID